MKSTVSTIAILFAIGSSAAAQQKQSAEVEKAIARLSFLAGEWTGTGTMKLGPGKSAKATVRESGTFKLEKSIFMIEGQGTATLADGRKLDVHNAMGIISYDAAANKYRMRTYRTGGEAMDPDINVADNKIVWSFKSPRGGTIRFTLTVKDGVWTEVGEASRDEGKTWFAFFEMKLKRVKVE